jgi:hypothetical protein
MAVSSRSWLTVPEVQRHLSANVNAPDAAALEPLIDAACRAVETYLERRVVRASFDERHDGGFDFVRPRNKPAVVSAVYVDTARRFGEETKLPDSEWFVSGDDEGEGEGGSLVELLRPTPGGRGVVRVVYEGGWTYAVDEDGEVTADRIPPDIRRATLYTLQAMHLKGEKGLLGQALVSSPGGSVTPITTPELTAGIPKEARDLLDPYRDRRRSLWL